MKFTIHRRGVYALAHEPAMTIGMARMAEQAVIKYAIPHSPKRTTHYMRGLGIGTIGTEVYIVSEDFKTWWIERGTRPHRTRRVGTKAHFILQRTAEHAGWTFIPS